MDWEGFHRHFGIRPSLYAKKYVVFFFCSDTQQNFDQLHMWLTTKLYSEKRTHFTYNNCKFNIVPFPESEMNRQILGDRLAALNAKQNSFTIFDAKLLYPMVRAEREVLALVPFLRGWAPVIEPPYMEPVDSMYRLAFAYNAQTALYYRQPPSTFLPAAVLFMNATQAPAFPNAHPPPVATASIPSSGNFMQAISWDDDTSSESSMEDKPLASPKRSRRSTSTSPASDAAKPDAEMTEAGTMDETITTAAESKLPDDDSHTTMEGNVFFRDSQELAALQPAVDNVAESLSQASVYENPANTQTSTAAVAGSQLDHDCSQLSDSETLAQPEPAALSQHTHDTASSPQDRDNVDAIYEALANFGTQEELYYELFQYYFQEMHSTVEEATLLLSKLIEIHDQILEVTHTPEEAALAHRQRTSSSPVRDSLLRLCPLPQHGALLIAYIDAHHLSFADCMRTTTAWTAAHRTIRAAHLPPVPTSVPIPYATR